MMNQAQMSDTVAAMVKAEMAKQAATQEVDDFLSSHQTTVAREKLIQVRMSDPGLFAMLTANAPAKPGATQRAAVKGTGTGGMTPLQQFTDPAYAIQMREKHTSKDGKFNKDAYAKEYAALREQFRFTPVQGAA